MGKNKICMILLAILMTSAFQGCVEKPVKLNLADLGGVYGSEERAVFDMEISGRLTEGNTDGMITEDDMATVYISNDPNKLLRWGIKRNTENRAPDADPGAPALLKKYGSIYIGDTANKTIYLTFDEGYENGYTPKILDALRENHVKAVFFITGPYLKEHEDLVRRMVEEGHTVGNHTIHHPSLPELGNERMEEEIAGLDRVFHEKFNRHMKYLRPPKGEYSERTLEITQKLGYTNLFWSFAYDDWYRDKTRGADFAFNIVMRNLHPGAVLLLHAVSKDNADALDKIIKEAKNKGYSFGDIEEIMP